VLTLAGDLWFGGHTAAASDGQAALGVRRVHAGERAMRTRSGSVPLFAPPHGPVRRHPRAATPPACPDVTNMPGRCRDDHILGGVRGQVPTFWAFFAPPPRTDPRSGGFLGSPRARPPRIWSPSLPPSAENRGRDQILATLRARVATFLALARSACQHFWHSGTAAGDVGGFLGILRARMPSFLPPDPVLAPHIRSPTLTREGCRPGSTLLGRGGDFLRRLWPINDGGKPLCGGEVGAH